jgi:hypothetical protein
MRHFGNHRARWLALLTGGAALATVVATIGLSASPTAGGAKTMPRPHPQAQAAKPATVPATPVSYPVTAMNQQFTSGTQFFCPQGSGNAPCDGAPTDYGTIDRVPSGFSNGGYGNYAPSITALYRGYMARVSGDGDVNQAMGCPTTTATSNPGENCSGPYALFGVDTAEGRENVFPKNGFTVTDDLYLTPSTAPVAGSLVDDDVEINNSTGTYGIDNVITACYETGGFVINFGHGSPGSCTGSPVVTSAGWYRFVFDFSNSAGKAYLTESVLKEGTLTVVATSGQQTVGGTPTATPISYWGGPGYFWLPSEDISGLPLANFALQLGQHPTGHTP